MSSILESCEVFQSELLLNELLNVIDMNNSITFISIGCACFEKWDINHDQQYPIFIRNFKKYYENAHVNLILIDPMIDTINCLCEHLGNNKLIVKSHLTTTEVPLTQYRNILKCNDNITIYTFNDNVSYAQHTNVNPNSVDITEFLKSMNDMCISSNSVLIVHDFSGMEIGILDKYFSDYTEIYSNKILYDISGGTQSACFIDMADPINHVVIRYSNEGIQIDNINKTNSHLINFIINDKNQSRYDEVVIRKLKRRKKYIYDDFIFYFNNLRRVIIWKNSIVRQHDIEICYNVIREKELYLIDQINHTQLVLAYKHMSVYEIYDILKRIFETKKKNIESLFDVQLNFSYDCASGWMNEIDKIKV